MAKPKLALIPAAQGTKLYSVLPSDGTGDFTFTRGSVATRINAQGLIENVASGQSRLNYPLIDGVQKGCPHHILEPARTNLIQYSESFSNAYWINNGVTISANQIVSPSGSLTADLLTGVSGGFGIVRFSTWTSTNKVASCFAKKGSSNLFKIANVSGGIGGVTFNLENGNITNEDSGFEGEIENYGNGWFRCTAIDTSARSGTFSLGVTAASESVYIWGAQLESDYKTSYIPTNGESGGVTRSAETATGAGNSTTFNDSEGCLMAEISALADDGTFRMIGVFDEKTTNEDRIQIYYRNDANKISFLIEENNVNQFVKTLDVTTIQYNKVALKYGNTSKVYINGFKLAEESGVAIPNNLQRLSFNEQNGSNNFYGNTKQVQYFNSALADTQLEQLTSWQSFRDMANGQLYTIE